MILDLGRMRGPIVVLIAVAIALGCYGTLVNVVFGRHNRWLNERDNTSMDPTSIELGARRALGLVRERGAHGTNASERLGVLVGASVLKTGINPTLLTSEIGCGYRWANLVTSGYPFDFNLMIKYMYRCGLSPDALVLVMNPSALAPRTNHREERVWYDPGILVEHAIKLEVAQARQDVTEISLVPWKLAFPYRGHVSGLVGRSLFEAKLRMLDTLGLGLAGLYAPAPYPWDEDQAKHRSPPLTTDATKRGYLGKLRNFGWFDPDRYRSDGPNFAFLVEIFRLTHVRGTRSFMVFVPESRLYRANVPQDYDLQLKHTLRETLGPAAPIVLDFREFLPDEEFHDVVHVTEVGLAHFTRGLADSLKPYLRNGNPAGEPERQ